MSKLLAGSVRPNPASSRIWCAAICRTICCSSRRGNRLERKWEVGLNPTLPENILEDFQSLRNASRLLRRLPGTVKTQALEKIAESLLANEKKILAANAEDLARLDKGTAGAFRDRLTLNPKPASRHGRKPSSGSRAGRSCRGSR